MKKNLYTKFLIVFYCLTFSDPLEKYLKVTGIQEIYSFILFILALVFLKRREILVVEKRDFKIVILIAVFLLSGFLGNIKSGYQNNIYSIISALLSIRFIFAYFTTKLIFENFNLYEYRDNFNKKIKIIIVFIVLIGLVFQVLNVDMVYESLYGIKITNNIFNHLTILNSFCVMLITFLTFFLNSNREYMKYIIILLLLMSTTFKSKALIFVGVYILFMIYFCYRDKSKSKWWISRSIIVFIFIPIAIICFKVFYNKYFLFKVTYGDTARNVLLETSKILFKDNFPIGVGFGTFASAMSGKHYSQLYYDYGISNTYGMTPNNYSFISDSFWPMILGENGFIGFVIFIIILLCLIVNVKKYRRKTKQVYYFSAYIPLIYLLIASLGESSFAHPMAVGLIFSYSIIIVTMKNIKD